ncbi:dynactin subunit 3-like isoform X2 [Dreissena polymorpha]|uniref:dynactin subunit 3-like isoform X2 n=1 Tax=Dreissena polymorpha TaxID=45954 RepID=UPI0022645A50|nr:dynactin subunit 3-like isoform X2 [Dreissena polymorpha]
MADSLEALEKRLEMLETKVFGASNKDAHYPRCTDTLANVQTRLGKSVAGKKKINRIFERLNELQDCLDPAKADEMTLSDDAKVEVILAEEDLLLQQSARLETLEQLKGSLDSEHIKAVPGLGGRLQELSQVQLRQQDEAGHMSEQAYELLTRYNSIVNLLSKQFVQWDETLTRLEQAKFTKKPLD